LIGDPSVSADGELAAPDYHAFSGAQLFLFHCHNLEHEDADMMVNFRIPA
jgi:FtsP/CotA-like multicopper oxidase with cupredoxin domain